MREFLGKGNILPFAGNAKLYLSYNENEHDADYDNDDYDYGAKTNTS